MKKLINKLLAFMVNLQLFAEAGTLITGTQNYVNAYTGETTPFSGKDTMNGELKTFYDTELLENARVDMYYAQFAKKQPLPSGRGKTVEWRKWNTFARADKLEEGVIPTGQKFGMSSKTGAINQYGTYASITDQLELHAYDDVILGATEEMGASAAETQEVLIRDALYTNTNVLYCDNINPANGAYVDTPKASGGLCYDENKRAVLSPDMINKAVTKLKKDKVKPAFGGKYAAVIHPSVSYDLRSHKDWVEAHKYAATTEIFNGEIGELHGVRFIEDVFAPVIKGEDLASNSRTLLVNNASGYTGAITSIAFDGGTVAENALKGRAIEINGIVAFVSSNTTSSITIPSTNFGTIADNAVIYPGEGAKNGEAAYATYFFGKDGFGIIDPEGGALQMIAHSKEEIGGPLNQFSTVGYKFETNGATMLYPERVLRVMSASAYSATDEAN